MSSEPVSPEAEAFEPLDFWELNKTKILAYAALIIVGLGGYGAYEFNQYQTTTRSQLLFAEAKTVGDFEKIYKEFPKTVVGGNAMLKAADKLREEKKYDEAVAVLKDFGNVYANHPLASGGLASLALTYELQGKPEDALTAYQQVVSKAPTAYTAPSAMIAQARLWLAQGKPEEARRLYQDVAARFPNTLFAREAMQELRYVKK